MKRKVLQYFALIGGFVVMLATLHFLHFGGITGFVILQDSTQGNFDGGTYSNTGWNGSAVVLYGNNLTGTFTSRIFDAGDEVRWNNLSWTGGEPSVIGLYTGDAPADIWKSFDGASWELIKDDYNAGDSNGGTDIEKNSTHLFILYNQDLWISSDKGISWAKINDDYNGGEGQNGDALAIDSSNRIYIVEGDQDVWRSTNGGTSFSKVASNFNGGNGAVLGMAVNSTGAIFAADIQADIWVSLDQGIIWTLVKDDYNGVVGNGVDDLIIDSGNNLYLVDRQDFWRSINNGASWTLMNDDLNGAGDSNDGLVAYVDEKNNVYVIDGSEDLFKSTNNGTTFTNVLSNFNGGSGNVFGLNSFLESSNLSFEARNCSSSDCSDGNWQTVDLGDLNLEARYFQYRVNLSSPDESVSSYVSSVAIDYTILNSPPSIILIRPQDGSAFGDNESISLDFTAFDSDGNIDSCWYSINGGADVLIFNCENTTFDVAGSGSHSLQVFVNDSEGEESSDSVLFNVQIGSPSITLNSPATGAYYGSGEIVFRYTPNDIDLQSCSLWGDFTGTFSLNQTDSSPLSGSENVFSLSLPDGTYFWNVACNDSGGNNAFNGNRTFHIDTENPSLVISQPSGTKNSRENISIDFDVNDESTVVCLYNVFRGSSMEIGNTSIECGSNNETFDVTVDASFVLNLYVTDAAGNFNSANSNFIVDSSDLPEIPTDESSGGGFYLPKVYNETTSIKADFSSLEKILLKRGTGTTFVIEITNKEGIYLNHCGLEFEGEVSNWFSSTQLTGLSNGQREDFAVAVLVPIEAEPGVYTTNAIFQCDEGNEVAKIDVVVYRNSFEAEILDYEKDGNDLIVSYSLKEYSSEEHDLAVYYSLIDFDGVPRFSGQQSSHLAPEEFREEELRFTLPKDSFGEFNLFMEFSDGLSEVNVSTGIFLPSTRTFTGLAISEDQRAKLSIIGIIVAVLLFILLIAWVVIRSLKKKKREKLKDTKRFSGKRKLMEIEL